MLRRAGLVLAAAAAAAIATAVWFGVRGARESANLPAPGPSIRDPHPGIALAGPGRVEKSLDAASEVSANGRGEVKVAHEDPVRLVRSYHQAVDLGDMEAITECYIPERRAGVAGMLGVVPRGIEWGKLSYEIAESRGEVAFVQVWGKGVRVDHRLQDVSERIKVRKVRGHWYLDDF